MARSEAAEKIKTQNSKIKAMKNYIEIISEQCGKPENQVNKLKLQSALLGLMGELNDMRSRGEEVTSADFDALGKEGRWAAMMAMCVMNLQMLSES